MDRPYWLGIDPGASGGVAIISADGWADAWPIDGTEADTAALIREVGPGAVFSAIEAVHAFPGQGVASMFSFGRSYGFLRGLLFAYSIRFSEIAPRQWQSRLGIAVKAKTESKAAFKKRLRGRAQQLFPGIKVTLATADALLIAEACRRMDVRDERVA